MSEDDFVYFNLKCGMQKRWIPAFLSMLKRLEENGINGHSEITGMLSDGAGGFAPVFKTHSKHAPDKYNPPIPTLYAVGHTIFDADMDAERLESMLMDKDMDKDIIKACTKVMDDGWIGKMPGHKW